MSRVEYIDKMGKGGIPKRVAERKPHLGKSLEKAPGSGGRIEKERIWNRGVD